MTVNKVLCIEDSASKYMDINIYLNRRSISIVDWATNAKDALEDIENAINSGSPYDLLISDMHFDFYGKDDREAGEKTLNLIWEKGWEIPVIFCSSQDWTIPRALGNIFYNPDKDWESEADELFDQLRNM